jgi:predicted metal-dependent phosphoesterase TrpH
MEAFFRAQKPIDLHLHSNVSDGTDTPAEVVRAAHAAGVRTMALTDHDTTAGWSEAAAECTRLGMTFIGGMEITAVGARGGGVHLLAYLFDPKEERLLAAVNRVLDARIPRLQEMTERLAVDYAIEWDDVLAESDGDSIGRPHLASAMIRRGHAADVDDFFERIVTKDSKYYVPSPGLDVREAIDLVRGAGGVPITAHPVGRHQHVMPREHMVALKEAGLAGFELGHIENQKNPAGLARLEEYAAEFDLIVTGSSDYHGARKSNRPGDFTTEPEMLMRIIDEATGFDPVYP